MAENQKNNTICWYVQVHQPLFLRQYSLFDVGKHDEYFDDKKNLAAFEEFVENEYVPANELVLSLLKQNPNLKLGYSISGITLEQFEQYAPEALESVKALLTTGRVELLAETYYHSLANIFSADEYNRQVLQHTYKVQDLLGVKPQGQKSSLQACDATKISLMTIDAHQQRSVSAIADLVAQHADAQYLMPSEAIEQFGTSGADQQTNTGPLLENQMQQEAAGQLYDFEKDVMQCSDERLKHQWGLLQASDHLSYMSTKWCDGADNGGYGNPYDSPYEGFIYFMYALKDLKQRLAAVKQNS